VWTDYRGSTDGRTNQSIVVFDLQIRQAQVIVGGPLDDGTPVVRFARGISGDIVVWEQETRCDSCSSDIYGFNLATGQEFPIAVGEAFYTNPSISGNRVVWGSSDGQTDAIEGLNLVMGERFRVAEHQVGDGFRFRPPVIDGDVVVWAEQSGDRKSPTTTIYALDLATGRRVTVATGYMQGGGYDVSGQRVVWVDPQVNLFDLDSGERRVLSQGRAGSLAIDGDLVVWSDSRDHRYTGWDVFGYDLRTDQPFLVTAAPGDQFAEALQGERVVWRDIHIDRGQVVMLDLQRLRPVLPPRRPSAFQSRVIPQSSSLAQAAELSEAAGTLLGSMPADLWKGMHAANGDGWGIASPAPTDAIVDDNGNPYFKYFTVLDSDLYRLTGYPAWDPRGDEVGDLFETIRDKGGYVVVRLFPTKEPCPQWFNCDNPEDVAQQYIALASNTRGWDWIHMVQTGNEPNIEWSESCTRCRWEVYPGGPIRTFSWGQGQSKGEWDYHLYEAINQWYIDVWNRVEYYKNNHPDPTVRARLANMTRYTPAMADIYTGHWIMARTSIPIYKI